MRQTKGKETTLLKQISHRKIWNSLNPGTLSSSPEPTMCLDDNELQLRATWVQGTVSVNSEIVASVSTEYRSYPAISGSTIGGYSTAGDNEELSNSNFESFAMVSPFATLLIIV
jgi:hypothetical protein